jgi:mycofactocin precursor
MDQSVTTEPARSAEPVEIGGVDEPDDELIEEDELLVEEISIDGMCGVY